MALLFANLLSQRHPLQKRRRISAVQRYLPWAIIGFSSFADVRWIAPARTHTCPCTRIVQQARARRTRTPSRTPVRCSSADGGISAVDHKLPLPLRLARTTHAHVVPRLLVLVAYYFMIPDQLRSRIFGNRGGAHLDASGGLLTNDSTTRIDRVSPEKWTVGDVGVWLGTENLGHLRSIFRRNKITGPALLSIDQVRRWGALSLSLSLSHTHTHTHSLSYSLSLPVPSPLRTSLPSASLPDLTQSGARASFPASAHARNGDQRRRGSKAGYGGSAPAQAHRLSVPQLECCQRRSLYRCPRP
jgi:hypothetical protein